ncbi:MAG: branched-chain amino acid ABC transporter permease [Chloroflexi bacterium]|nr:branched-chain amino acid ABC transporter permease [Chloroflexota bacterium]
MRENRLHRRHPLVQFLLDNGIYIIIAIVMWRLPFWLGEYFDKPITELGPRDVRGNVALSWMAVAIELYIVAILAMSYNLILGFGGLLSFGHALFFGTGVYAILILMTQYSHSLMLSTGMALGLSVVLGFMVVLAAYRIKGVYFAMFTLALAQVFYELSRVNLTREITNGDDGIRFIGDNTPEIGLTVNRLDLYYLCAIVMALTFVFIRRLMNSPAGKVILAIRDNEERTQTMGYNVARYKALVILLGSLLGTLSGVLHALSSKGAEPGSLSVARTVDPLIMTIIGGLGTNPGPVIGAALLHLGEVFLSKPDLHVDLNFLVYRYTAVVDTRSEWALALGIVFVIIVMVIPYGVVGQVNKIWIQVRRWLRKFFYDPLIRQNEKLATWMEPFTGEPPQVAIALAQLSSTESVSQWVFKNPHAVLTSILVVVPVIVGFLQFDWRATASTFLFLLVIIVPLRLILWGAQKFGFWDTTTAP